jgi:hypothetical protein
MKSASDFLTINQPLGIAGDYKNFFPNRNQGVWTLPDPAEYAQRREKPVHAGSWINATANPRFSEMACIMLNRVLDIFYSSIFWIGYFLPIDFHKPDQRETTHHRPLQSNPAS